MPLKAHGTPRGPTVSGMKLTLTLVIGLLALGACRAASLKVSATSSGLDDEETAIVNGFLELIQGVVAAGGDIDKMTDTLNDIKGRVEKKLKANGAEYLDKLAKTLTSVRISDENVNAIVTSINDMAEKDGVNIKSKSRSKRSPKKKFKKFKKKKGKGKGKKGGCGK